MNESFIPGSHPNMNLELPDNDDSDINEAKWHSVQKVPFTPEAEKAFDDIVQSIASTDVTVYERLNASNDKVAKEEFLANLELIRPNNEYGNLHPNEITTNLAKLNQIDVQISQVDLTEQRKRLLTALSNDCRRKNDFLLANIEYNSAITPEEKAKAIEHYRTANEALYGKPDETTFNALLLEKIAKIDVASLSPDDRMRYDKLLTEIGPLGDGQSERFKPKPETVQRFSELTKEFFGGFLKHIPENQTEFTSEDMARITNEILTEEFSDEPDSQATVYSTIVSPSASNASVNHEKRQIIFPESKTYSRAKAVSLIVHELGAHTMRAIPYTEQSTTAFSMGFPDNETFDEGVAKCVEQAIDGKYVDSGIEHYINIGLATFKGKNFREVYEIQHTLNDLCGQSSKSLLNGVQRCFRGTGELPNNKDLAYYNGATKVWQYIEDHIDDPELFDNLFLAGKLDIANPEQAAISYEKRTGNL